MGEERWQRLEVWQLADQMAYRVYIATRNFPKEELYGLTSQLRRAVLSVPTNIVEGYSRKGQKELAQFLNISVGSMAEAKYLLHFAHRMEFLSNENYDELKNGYDKLGKKLWKFYETVRNKVKS